MFSLFIREKVCDHVGSLQVRYPLNSDTDGVAQLYIGEACWAFLFGVIIGASTIIAPRIYSPHFDHSWPSWNYPRSLYNVIYTCHIRA
jgi:hypothetical protein